MEVNKRKVFDLKGFVEDVDICLYTCPENIDEVLEPYKDLLRHNKSLIKDIRKYVESCSLITNNEEVMSYINSCYT